MVWGQIKDSHPADILVQNWIISKPAIFDITVTALLNSTILTEAGATSKSAAMAAEVLKHLFWLMILSIWNLAEFLYSWRLKLMVDGVQKPSAQFPDYHPVWPFRCVQQIQGHHYNLPTF